MSDIHQEWRELRQKNGDFICHLDGEMAKLEKKQVELKHREQLQNLADAGAFAMQFAIPFNCCQDDCDILKALNKAQADRIETLEKEIIARKEQAQIDLAVKKDLDEKLDKATADYRALWVENDNLNRELARLQSQLDREKAEHEEKIDNAGKSYARLAIERNNLAETVSNMEKTIRDLDERNGTLRERLAQTNARLKRSVQESNKIQDNATYLDNLRRNQAKEIKRLQEIVNAPNGSCSAYTQQGMKSKIAKQAAEIKRLTEELETANKDSKDNFKRCNVLRRDNADLKESLKIVAKDAKANFERGRIKGMEEIWGALQWTQDHIETGYQLMPIYRYYSMADCVNSLTATAFLRKTIEWQNKEARDIQIGDEVEIFDRFYPDDDQHSDIGIVVKVDSDGHSFAVIGPNLEGCFDDTDIQNGDVRKTGQHFDSIPLNYFK